jgi:hypothetical protein
MAAHAVTCSVEAWPQDSRIARSKELTQGHRRFPVPRIAQSHGSTEP